MDDQEEQMPGMSSSEEEEYESRAIISVPGIQERMQDVDVPIKEPIGASVQQEQTQQAEHQFIQDLISSPDKMRVSERNMSSINILTTRAHDDIIVFSAVKKQ